MKRTLNSVYATRPLPNPRQPRRKRSRPSPSLFSPTVLLPPFDSSACFNHNAAESMPLSSQYRFEGSIFERENGARPASSRCRVRKQFAEKSGWESGPLIAALVAPVLSLFAGIIPAGSGIIKLQRLFRRNCYECHCNRTTWAVVSLFRIARFSPAKLC